MGKTPTKVYVELAQLIDAYHRCCADGDKTEWANKHKERIEALIKEFFPHGSGFDSGCEFDLDKSNGEKLVIHTSYHHMNEGGMYDGWTDHTVTVRPSLAFGFRLSIGGRNRNQIKDYMYETFDAALNETTTKE